MKDPKIIHVSHEGTYVSYEPVKLSDYVGYEGERLLTHHFLRDTLRKLMGRTLTVIDASISGAQNKAIKDLIRHAYSEELAFASEMAYEQDALKRDVALETPIEPISIEQALGL